jgi:SAV_6107-like HEPN
VGGPGASVAPPRSGLPGSASALLAQARIVLVESAMADDPGERFRLAHLAALRIAAALFAERGRPARARRRLINAWELVETVAPEFAEWAAYFSVGAAVRAAVEAGATTAVGQRGADDQLRAAQEFLCLVESALRPSALRPLALRPLATALAS